MACKSLSGESLELLSERRLRPAGILRLSFAHHVNHLDPVQDRPGRYHRLEPEHWANLPLDSPVVLLDAIVQVGTLPDPDRLQLTPRSVLETVYSIAGQDRFAIGLAAVDDNPLGPAVSPLLSMAR